MAPLTLEVRHNEGTIECWDDDDELQCYEDIHLRAASTATSVTNSSVRRSGHRDSISSRRSARSDLDSNAGGDEDWQVQLLDDDETVNEDALLSAKNAGIPLPTNVPRSALIGGTIKRLGRRKTKRDFIDDWSEDVELPGPDGVLELKRPRDLSFPESLLAVENGSSDLDLGKVTSCSTSSPVKSLSSPFRDEALKVPTPAFLESFRDSDLDDTQDVPTIKVAKPQSLQRPSIVSQPGAHKETAATEDFENDFELPEDDDLLQLSRRQATARASSPTPDEFDVDWSEGSIGIRFGGTTRDHRSNPSSSVSIVSPSASSYLTGESDDEGLDGLVIPEGPLNLEACLERRTKSSHAETSLSESIKGAEEQLSADEFFSDLEIRDGDAFNPRGPSVNPNIKCKMDPLGSPARRSTTLTFTNGPVSPKTRIPRLSSHDRPHSTHLETVSESGAPLSKFGTFQRRGGGHVSHSSVSSLPASGSATLSPIPFTPNRRLVGTRISDSSFSERLATSRQLLKPKGSLPSMRNTQQVTPPSSSSETLHHTSPGLTSPPSSRFWTAVDRARAELRPSGRKPQTPFLPPGASEKQSHHASVKSYRYSRRTSSDGTSDTFGSQGSITRLPRSSRHEITGNTCRETTPETLGGTPKRTLTRPTRRRNFGDGSELASFDDLPTSYVAESKFVKQPSGRGAPRSLRNRLSQSHPIPSKLEDSTTQQVPPSSTSLQLHNFTPRFARDTNASRNAREQRIASMTSNSKSRESNPLAPLSSNWKSPNTSRVPSGSATVRSRKSKSISAPGSRPHLIKPIGAGVQEPKSVNGMHYNPASFRWEGNENFVHGFDTTSPKSPKPSPALITNVGVMQNVQVVGGMVFDPHRMCWLKLAPSQHGTDRVIAVQDEDDVFSSLADLKETSGLSSRRAPGTYDDIDITASGEDRSCEDSSDEWPITEEFDVGPEFIRRQHTEEEKWKRKVDKWIGHDHAGFEAGWRWAIRDLVRFNNPLGALELQNA